MGRTWGDAPVQAFLTIPSFLSSRSTPRGRLMFPTCQAKATRLGATTFARLRPVSRGRCRKTRRLRRKPVRKRVGTWAPRLPVAGLSNMAIAQDVHVRICNQEIVKFDLEVKALIQVLMPGIPARVQQPQIQAQLGFFELSGFTPELSPLGQVPAATGPAPCPLPLSCPALGPVPPSP